MSSPLPIGDILNESFQFGLRRWPTVIRYAWAPVVLSFILLGLFFASVFDFQALQQIDETEVFPGFEEILQLPGPVIVALAIALYLIIGALYSGIMASIFRLVALGEERPGFFQVRLDGPAWRVFWATIIMGVLSMLVWVIATGAALAISGISIGAYLADMGAVLSGALAAIESGSEDAFNQQVMTMTQYWKVFVLSIVVAFIPLIYLGTRLAPFLAGSAAENRLILFGSFALTQGRFWSVFGAMLLMGLMIFVISIMFQIVTSLFELMIGLGGSGGAFALIAMILSVAYFGLVIFYYAVIYGVQMSLQAIIYRRLKTGE